MGVIYLLYHKDFVERMRNQYPPGTRVEVVSLCNEEEHLKPGSLQMIERPLMMTDELKTMPKGQFIVMKTGAHPMKVKLKLFSSGASPLGSHTLSWTRETGLWPTPGRKPWRRPSGQSTLRQNRSSLLGR